VALLSVPATLMARPLTWRAAGVANGPPPVQENAKGFGS